MAQEAERFFSQPLRSDFTNLCLSVFEKPANEQTAICAKYKDAVNHLVEVLVLGRKGKREIVRILSETDPEIAVVYWIRIGTLLSVLEKRVESNPKIQLFPFGLLGLKDFLRSTLIYR